MRSALLAFVGVPTILLVVAACRSILVNESNDISLATAYSRGQSESGIQRESVLSVGAAAGCRLAHCAPSPLVAPAATDSSLPWQAGGRAPSQMPKGVQLETAISTPRLQEGKSAAAVI